MDIDSINFFTLSISLNLFKYARVNLSFSWITLNSWCWSVSLSRNKGHWTLQWRLAPNYCTMHVQAPRMLYGGLYTLSHCYRWPTLSCYTYFTHAPLGWSNHHSYPNLFFYKNVLFRESSVQYLFRQWRTSHMMGEVDILLGMLKYKLSLISLFVWLLGAQGIWHGITTTIIDVHPTVGRGSTFRVSVLCMDITMAQTTP